MLGIILHLTTFIFNFSSQQGHNYHAFRINQMMNHSDIDISREFLALGAEIIVISGRLAKSSLYRPVINQLLRSGTSAGANYEEACGAQSKADFIHKLHICFKELKETAYWLHLIKKSGIVKENELYSAMSKSQMLLNIIGKSLITCKKNLKDEV